MIILKIYIRGDPPAKGIKVMNGINGKNGTWVKDKVSIEIDGSKFSECVLSIMQRRTCEEEINQFHKVKKGGR